MVSAYWYAESGVLRVICPEVPDRVCVSLPDERDRDVWTAKQYVYVPEAVAVDRGDTDKATSP